MSDPLSPTPLSEQEIEALEMCRASFSPPEDFVCGVYVQRIVAALDRLSPGVAEPPAEDRDEKLPSEGVILIRGNLGWSNRKGGLEAYGPGGRWEGQSNCEIAAKRMAQEVLDLGGPR